MGKYMSFFCLCIFTCLRMFLLGLDKQCGWIVLTVFTYHKEYKHIKFSEEENIDETVMVIYTCRMRSIIDRLKGSRDFPRLRIGIVFIFIHFNIYSQCPSSLLRVSLYVFMSQGLDGLQGRWIQPIMFFASLTNKNRKRYRLIIPTLTSTF